MTKQIYHSRSMYELRNGPRPSYAQLDGTEPEFEIRRARRVAVPREQARLIVVPPLDKQQVPERQACQDDTGTRR